MTPEAALEKGLAELRLELPEAASGQLLRYRALLEKWNRAYNLTAIRDPLQAVIYHLLDSLAIIPHLPDPEGSPLADVGSGGGLPGIPIAIARPDWRICLNDSRAKRAAFLRQAGIELRLPNVEVHEGRVESWKPATRFGIVVSRAFSQLSEFIRACRHLVTPSGCLAAMKGTYPHAELEAVAKDAECRVVRVSVPLLDAERHLVICRPAH